jgi:hypothetical protein
MRNNPIRTLPVYPHLARHLFCPKACALGGSFRCADSAGVFPNAENAETQRLAEAASGQFLISAVLSASTSSAFKRQRIDSHREHEGHGSPGGLRPMPSTLAERREPSGNVRRKDRAARTAPQTTSLPFGVKVWPGFKKMTHRVGCIETRRVSEGRESGGVLASLVLAHASGYGTFVLNRAIAGIGVAPPVRRANPRRQPGWISEPTIGAPSTTGS